MTKEDKQIIDRAVKEEWRTGDRTRLKRLLKKNLELYRENEELKKACDETQELLDKQIEATYKLFKEYEELKSELTKKADTNHSLVEQMAKLESENAELKEELKDANEKVVHLACNQNKDLKNKLTKAIELLKWALHSDPEHDNLVDFDTKWKEAEQFLKEIEN